MTGPPHGLPADNHVHSEWSWDAPLGSMEHACRRAVELGLPSLAFTEHVDFTSRELAPGTKPATWQKDLVEGRLLSPPAFDEVGYARCLDRCRQMFRGLRILSGVELGEPHLNVDRCAGVLRRADYDRVLASVHTLAGVDGQQVTVDAAFAMSPPDQVLRAYLREVRSMVEGTNDFDVLAHVDYAARYWPRAAGEFPLTDVEDDYRAVLSLLAAKGKALELNTRVPLGVAILRCWRDVRGETITFASDAHRPDDVARGFARAADFAASAGFGPGRDPHDLWRRH